EVPAGRRHPASVRSSARPKASGRPRRQSSRSGAEISSSKIPPVGGSDAGLPSPGNHRNHQNRGAREQYIAPVYRLGHFGAIHSRRQKATRATVPTPPSQRAANHNSRCASGRGFGSRPINDSRSRPLPCLGTPNRPTPYNRESAAPAPPRRTA